MCQDDALHNFQMSLYNSYKGEATWFREKSLRWLE